MYFDKIRKELLEKDNQKRIEINIAKDFSPVLGPGMKKDGQNSGEEFFDLLIAKLELLLNATNQKTEEFKSMLSDEDKKEFHKFETTIQGVNPENNNSDNDSNNNINNTNNNNGNNKEEIEKVVKKLKGSRGEKVFHEAEKFLLDYLKQNRIIIDLDGVEGYNKNFLNIAFSGIIEALLINLSYSFFSFFEFKSSNEKLLSEVTEIVWEIEKTINGFFGKTTNNKE